MKLNRKWILVASLVLSVAMATTGTLAFLTDRDSEANVLTFGNVEIDLSEEFVQGDTLVPGKKIEKEAIITNIGKTDAWVWMTYAIPAALDNDDASKNVIHVNTMGAYWDDYYTETKYIESAGLTEAVAYEQTWNVDYAVQKDVEIDGKKYNVYTHLYNGVLAVDEATTPGISQVYLDAHIDIEPNGDWYHVEKGTPTKLNWNTNTDGNPVIYVSAYAIQDESFETVEAAYAAYNTQWGDNGTEYGEPIAAVSDSEEMLEAIKAGRDVKLMDDIELSARIDVEDGQDIVIDMNGKTITDNSTGSTMTAWVKKGGSLTITGDGEIRKVNHAANILYFDGELNIMNGTFGYEPYTWGKGYCDADGAVCANRDGHATNPLKVGSIIVGRKGTEYAGVLNIYGGTFDCGVKNPEDFLSTNHEIEDPTKPVTMYAVINSHASHPMVATIYGGTFVSANPANGDVNEPHTLYLKGQTEAGVLPEGYTITESTLEDGRTAYTVNYNAQ